MEISRFRTIAFLILAITLFTSPLTIYAQSSVYKTKADLNLRAGPGGKYNSLTVVPKESSIQITDTSNSNWYKTSFNGKAGYVTSKYLTYMSGSIQVREVKPVVKAQPKPKEKNNYASIGGWILGIVVLFFILAAIGKKANKSQPPTSGKAAPAKPNYSSPASGQYSSANSQQVAKTNVNQASNTLNPLQPQPATKTPEQKNQSNIEDVTGKSQPIFNSGFSIPQNKPDAAPLWRHQYVYSARELNAASTAQKAFYKKFKEAFLQSKWLDLAGNSNYAFILLFDLHDDYKQHKKLDTLENQYRFLWANWPRTESYGRDILIREMIALGDMAGISRLNAETRNIYASNYLHDASLRLGNRFKDKLKLNGDQLEILNGLIDTSNSFNSIEYCSLQIIQSFLFVLDGLAKHFKTTGSSFDEQCKAIGEIEIAKHYKFRKGSNNYKNQIAEFPKTIRQAVFKSCENSLRDYLFAGRKTDLSYYIHSPEAIQMFDAQFAGEIRSLLNQYYLGMPAADDASEVELNQYSKSRWKSKLEIIKTNFSKEKAVAFYEAVNKLGEQNRKNPAVENIFLDASKFVAKHEPIVALKLYAQYIYFDLLSATFDNRQLAKTLQKSLFQNVDQVKDFQDIINQLIKDKNIEVALGKIQDIYKPKRKKIKIDTSKVREVQEQHAETVDLLNEYLQEEETAEPSPETKSAEVSITIDSTQEPESESIFKTDLNLTSVQESALTLFSKRGFSCTYEELDVFARENGAFRSSLVEGINENCYPVFDDILIEDEDGAYRINESYFQQILAA